MDPRIMKARTALVLDQPFFGALALRLQVVEDPSCETFWTDSVSLGYNPTYAASLNDLQLRGVLAHEVLHVANGHCWRQGYRDHEGWNEAADYSVNPLILEAGMLLPPGALMDARFNGRSGEEIYGMRLNEARQKAKQQSVGQSGQGQPGQSGQQEPSTAAPGASGQSPGASGKLPSSSPSSSCGEVRQYTGPDKAAKEAQWRVAVLQAAMTAKACGRMDGGLEAVIREMMDPIVDWRSLLHRFAQEAAPTDYSFSMPNRRYLHAGLYLPSLHEPAVGDAVFVRDASGSVWDETQAQFAAEIVAVSEALCPRRLIVMDCDTRVTQIQLFERGEPVELKPIRGGGGTSFVDPFHRLIKDGIDPAFLVYLTDMDGKFPTVAPAYPVLWASTTPLRRAKCAPFGEMVEVIC